ncbi:winged helix-turn-helix transcriptional regulator [Streptomyces sp. PSKA54]|uniref:Winged helix-turn-helix transcriptional regulator n=1 Tax=Streptomyces himalayensis subsp. aureolus TaxID=2758039 RepID=A0A7W2D6K9_9ACTN|nr:winged helix-turn-helix domain-containing protein [Streptomyces himalayensis]MBA4865601.1 winged helix-turn-helix transcriptional regulator [Streptomyces himalayensis subsp. aureolus]
MVVTEENVAVNGSRKLTPKDIADALRERIRTGTLKAGDRLPTQAELALEFGVERGTVRQALKTLQDDGLLANISKGSPPRIAAPAPTREGPQPTMVALAPRLTAAFAAPTVRIDVVSLTAETLMLALGEPVRLIHEGRIHPESIDVRILLPSRDIDLAFPVSVGDPGDDDPVHERWLAQRNAQGHVLRHNLLALRSSHGIDVHVTFRALPFTPPVKLYLLNGCEALLAYYMVTKREEEIESGTLEMYDALGTESLLFSFERRAGSRDTAFVEESQKWFDALWETITTDLTLS